MPLLRSNVPTRLVSLAVAGAFAGLSLVGPANADAADPARYKTYYDIFDRGDAFIPGTDTALVPQGLIYWPEQDALVISYYDSAQPAGYSRLGIIDRATGRTIKSVSLPEKGHVGGLGMAKGFLYVASDDGVSRYKTKNLAGTTNGGLLKRFGGAFRLKASSYMTTNGGKLWVGSFDDDVAYRYTLTSRGVPQDDSVSVGTPNETQGMVIAAGRYIFSSSFGRDNDSTLTVSGVRTILAPNMSEGIAKAKGEVHVVYESGSSFYGDADYRVKTVHHAPISRLVG